MKKIILSSLAAMMLMACGSESGTSPEYDVNRPVDACYVPINDTDSIPYKIVNEYVTDCDAYIKQNKSKIGAFVSEYRCKNDPTMPIRSCIEIRCVEEPTLYECSCEYLLQDIAYHMIYSDACYGNNMVSPFEKR